MKKLVALLLVIGVSGCAQSGYRDRYHDGYYYTGGYPSSDYGHYADDYYYYDDGFSLNLRWNAFPDRYGIAYGATFNGPYRYPRVGFYYGSNWYPSAWWGTYAAFDPWYSDYYYNHHYSGGYISLNFNFYDFDSGWHAPWFNTWGYSLAHNWFQPFHGWGHWSPFRYNSPHNGDHHYRDHRRHDRGWAIGPGYRPHYRGDDVYRHRRDTHSSARSEAARLAARRPVNHGRSTYRQAGRVGGYESHQPRNNPLNVVTRRYKRPAERQRSTRSTHRYNRVPVTNRPFFGQPRTAVQNNRHHAAGPSQQHRARHSNNAPRHARRITESNTNRFVNRHAAQPRHNRSIYTRTSTSRQPPHVTPVQRPHKPQRQTQPVIRNINRYRVHRPVTAARANTGGAVRAHSQRPAVSRQRIHPGHPRTVTTGRTQIQHNSGGLSTTPIRQPAPRASRHSTTPAAGAIRSPSHSQNHSRTHSRHERNRGHR